MKLLVLLCYITTLLTACDELSSLTGEEEEETSESGFISDENSLLLYNSETNRSAIEPKVSISTDGQTTILWTDFSGDPKNILTEDSGEYALYLSTLADQKLSPATLVAGPSTTPIRNSENLVNSSGTALITWTVSGSDNEIFYKLGTNDPTKLGTALSSNIYCAGIQSDNFYYVWQSKDDYGLYISWIAESGITHNLLNTYENYTVTDLNCTTSIFGTHVYRYQTHYLVSNPGTVETTPISQIFPDALLIDESNLVLFSYTQDGNTSYGVFDGSNWNSEAASDAVLSKLVGSIRGERIYSDMSMGGPVQTANNQTIFSETMNFKVEISGESEDLVSSIQLSSDGSPYVVFRYNRANLGWSEPETIFQNGISAFSTPLSTAFSNGNGLAAFSEYDSNSRTSKIRIKTFQGIPEEFEPTVVQETTCANDVKFSDLEADLRKYCTTCHNSSDTSRANLETEANLIANINESVRLVGEGSMPPVDSSGIEVFEYKLNCYKRSLNK